MNIKKTLVCSIALMGCFVGTASAKDTPGSTAQTVCTTRNNVYNAAQLLAAGNIPNNLPGWPTPGPNVAILSSTWGCAAQTIYCTAFSELLQMCQIISPGTINPTFQAYSATVVGIATCAAPLADARVHYTECTTTP